ncbi:hypothetical protein [Okeania sp. SIO1I7]|uniref:hypothetical protein n=1 Tax=Okeania sp. SIO1I7 TaxID=2607772 RepID=UPI0025DCC4EE|nr:hypothetical protein [Okeania sp. SIO1I7]
MGFKPRKIIKTKLNQNFELNKGVSQLAFSARLLPFFYGIINRENYIAEGRRKKEEGRRKKEE